MSSSDFREIAQQGAPGKAERLFRASISAYCCLSHPTRVETTQLEDLTMPLYPSVSDEGLRFASAALSECALPPANLARRLCSERVELGAPLIIKTSALTDADLIGLIARKGVAHARVIGRRPNLNPAIAALIRQIELQQAANTQAAAKATPASERPAEAEVARDRLRGMMVPSRVTRTGVVPIHAYTRLRAAALSGDRNQIIATLAQNLDIDLETSAGLLRSDQVPMLISALRALALTGEQALLVVACALPGYFARRDAARELVTAFASESMATARKRVDDFGPDHAQDNFAREISRAALARSA